MKLYIAGKITGDPDYKRKFDTVEKVLIEKGYRVMNPTVLPPTGFEWEEYIHICKAMIDVCDGIVMITGWSTSAGAVEEYRYAVLTGKETKFVRENGEYV